MTKELQASIKKLLLEFGTGIKEAEQFTGAHLHQFIELAVIKFGATQQSAAQGLAYAEAWPKALRDKLATYADDVKAEVEAAVKKVEQKAASIITSKPASAPITPTGNATQTPPVQQASKDKSFTVTE
jgi:hypothetical protein